MPPEITSITRRILIASFLGGIGKSTLWRMASQSEFARIADDQELADVFPELGEFRIRSKVYENALRKADRQIELANNSDIQIIGFWDAHYPRTFRKASLAPAIFWYKGNVAALDMPSIGIIGTRQPTLAGEESARRISEAMAEKGLLVVSGLALGIDAIAHQAALECNGATIAVLAGGLDNIGPKANTELAKHIAASKGGLLSEFPIGSPSFSGNFVTRDATQAALSVAVILVQSDRKGGSMHASRAILKLNRQLIVTAPVAIDVRNEEPKIEANLLFMNHGFSNLIANLQFPKNVQELTRILRSRDQYADVFEDIRVQWSALRPAARI